MHIHAILRSSSRPRSWFLCHRRAVSFVLRARYGKQSLISNLWRGLATESDLLPKLENDSDSPDWDRGGQTKENALTPLLLSMRRLIDANKGCVCLIQVGSFYELYFEQATLVAPKLGIKVAIKRTNNHSVPMAGFPVGHLRKFVKMLVHDLQVNVAVIDQYLTNTDTIMHRKVSRIVSPGTLVDESFINFSKNNYLVAISIPPQASQGPNPDLPIGLLWIDISVGEFHVQETTMADLASDLNRVSPSEVIMSKEYQDKSEVIDWISEMANLRKYFVRYHKITYGDYKVQLKSNLQTIRKKLEDFTVREESAMNMVLSYINVNLPDRPLSLDLPQQYFSSKYLHMDSRTRDALELTERLSSGLNSTVGTLLNTIKQTVTPSGTRLLTQWIKLPILDTEEIKKRQAFTQHFGKSLTYLMRIRYQLTRLGDPIRSLQKLALKAGPSVSHLLGIGEALAEQEKLKAILVELQNEHGSKQLQNFINDFQVPIDISKEILDTLYTDPVLENARELVDEGVAHLLSDLLGSSLTAIGDYKNDAADKEQASPIFVFNVKRDHDPNLSKLHDSLEKIQKEEIELLQGVRENVAVIDPKAVVTKKDQVGRYFDVIHISCRLKMSTDIANHIDKNGEVRERKKTTLIYKPTQWSRLQELRNTIVHKIEELEKAIIENLKTAVLEKTLSIRKVNRMADFIDITSSFAVLARDNDLVCPNFVKSNYLNILEGRHPVVEIGLKTNGEMFTPNDTKLGPDGNLWVISGPNMGGKSTFLRQNALIVIMAQIGCFVPAAKANIGIVDRIFTRIGASDDIFSDLSTFMVEMIETSNILSNATSRSLAIVDEIGRGTSGREGLAISYAALVSLLQTNKCRTLFATHFGAELKKLLDTDKVSQTNVRFYRTKVHTKEGLPNISFDHTLEPGISERSYAFEVAKLAGFPNHSLKHAERALKLLDDPKL